MMEKGLLPAVTKCIEDAVLKEVENDKDYFQKMFKKIEEENPFLFGNMMVYSASVFHATKQPNIDLELLYAGAFLYGLLEKSGPIPKVSRDTCFANVADILHSEDSAYASLLSRIESGNPYLADIIGKVAITSSNPKATWEALTLVYMLLEKQAEADKLKLEFKVQ